MKSWNEVEHASTREILAWAQQQTWTHAMADCALNSEWHAEGDVWTPTQMVVARLELLPEWPAL